MKSSIKKAALIILVVVLTLFYPGLGRTEDAGTLPLKQLLERVKKGPDVLASKAFAEESRYMALTFWQNTFLPKLVAIGTYDYLSKEVGINNPLSGIPLPPPLSGLGGSVLGASRELAIERVELQIPLLDIAKMSYESPSKQTLAEAASLKSERETKEILQNTIDLYLQCLELKAKRKALENYKKNLQIRQIEIRRLYELGGVSEAGLLKIKLGIEDSDQGIREIKQNEVFLGRMLARAIGESSPVLPEDFPGHLPPIEHFLLQKFDLIESREDLGALCKQINAADLESKAARASTYPQVSLFAGYTYADQEILSEKGFGDVGLRVTWPIFDGATGKSRYQAARMKKQALEHEKQSAILAIQAQVDNAWETLKIKSLEYTERQAAVKDSKEAADLDFKRLKTGKVTVNDVIDSVDILRDREEKAALSKISWYRELFKYQTAAGKEPEVPE